MEVEQKPVPRWKKVLYKKKYYKPITQLTFIQKPYYQKREKIEYDTEVDYLFYTKKTAVSCVEFVLRGE